MIKDGMREAQARYDAMEAERPMTSALGKEGK